MKKPARRILAAGLVLTALLTACTPAVTPQTAPSTAAPTQSAETAAPVQIREDYDSLSISELMALDHSLTWVFAGDSITHNGTWTQGMNGYPDWFEQLLYDLGRGDDSVINTAWGGADIQDFQTMENTPRGSGTISDPGMGIEQFITKYDPDVVFIKLGMNNRGMSDAEFLKYYELMLEGIYAAGEAKGKIPKIILLTPTPVSGESIYNTEQTDYDSTWRFQKSLKKLAADRELLFVDLQTAFTQEALVLGSDYAYTFYTDPSDGGLHPNGAGQYLIFKTISKALGLYDETLPIFQVEYDDFRKAPLYTDDTAIASYFDDFDNYNWTLIAQQNYLWAVTGAQQMSGYEGADIHRSLFRQLENGIRGGDNNMASCRDIRLMNLASPSYTMSYLAENYGSVIGQHESLYDVLMILPEVPEVYDSAYVHSADAVAAYQQNVEKLVSENRDKLVVLWTPLASGDDAINAVLTDYADAIRQIATDAPEVYLFDANSFMNIRLASIPSLKDNWFGEGAHITPLCATDLAYGFYSLTLINGTNKGELVSHNLRLATDTRTFKSTNLRDNIAAGITVSGTEISVDASAILEKYPEMTGLRVAVLPEAGAGSYHKDLWTIAELAGGSCTFEAPCANPILTVFGELDGYTYRFKDQTVAVETTSSISKPAATSETLTSLEVVGAPEFAFDPAVTTYDIELYQYQQNIQVRACAGDNLTILVNGQEVPSGERSQQIGIGDTETVTVSAGSTTYTLNLTRPSSPDILITEVMTDGYLDYDQAGGDNYDLIEIYNASGKDLNLLDYAVGYKKDYPYVSERDTEGKWPHFFTGNDQAFQSTSSNAATYTGINPITKYSACWDAGSEPEEVLFPADSTMVIWVKYVPDKAEDPEGYASALTYGTLTAALEAHAGTHTLTVEVDGADTAVIPAQEQLVVAEIPLGKAAASLPRRNVAPAQNASQHFYLENHGTLAEEHTTRSWLFILKDTAAQAANGAITEAGNDIISAARYIRLANSDKLSTLFTYHADRGMALVKALTTYDEAYTTGHTSDQQGYCNLTSFGAIEYWQKPADLADTTLPVVTDNSAGNTIDLTLTDDTDVRYLELYVKANGTDGFEKITRDFVLEAGIRNGGISTDQTSVTFTLALDGKAEYYGFVTDGNGNQATFGTEAAPLPIG